ncbi:MAG: cysteine--tRNA ligase [Candidatus Firestonebacteria bacterium]
MPLRIYNTLTQKKEEFIPVKKGEAGIYNCGPTVYGYFHVGNARNFIVIDAMRKYLEFSGYKVKLVQNVTDVDDKIINKAKAEQVTPKEIAEKFTADYFEDLERLGVRRADYNPKATEHIKEMQDLIKLLIEKGEAYEINGDVYFSVGRAKERGYGKLSHKKIEELEAGSRIDVNEQKKDPLDFALWKKDKEDGISWDSPWGKGRPGWHTECCVMSVKYLGQPFDIHSGGIDLVFPHHENELAQVEAAYGSAGSFAKYWLHNGHLNIKGQKMSKSLDNFLLVRDILKTRSAGVVRFFLLSAHYRSPLDWTEENVANAVNGFTELVHTQGRINAILEKPLAAEGAGRTGLTEKAAAAEAKFILSMDDDFNTAAAIGALFEFAAEIKNILKKKDWELTPENREELRKTGEKLTSLSACLGLTLASGGLTPEAAALVSERERARTAKDWTASDELRKKIDAAGYCAEDSRFGQIVFKK